MKSILFFLSVLALTAWVHTIPCVENRCGGYNYMGAPSIGYANANVEDDASGVEFEMVEEKNGGLWGYNGGGGGAGYNGVDGAGYEGGGDGGGRGYNGGGGGGYNGGGEHNGGGGYKPPRRNNYCPNCYAQNFGNGMHNANTINIKHRRN